MNTYRGLVRKLLQAALACACLGAPVVQAALEQHFPVLKIGANTYTNVTVTSKTRTYIFFLHSTGMMNVKLVDLSPELREELGYTNEPPKPPAPGSAKWVKQEFDKLPLQQVANVEHRLNARVPLELPSLKALDRRILLMAAVIGAVCYLCFSYCCLLICRKSGSIPGVIVWVPFFQAVPLLRAANMSPWWLLAGFVPLLNVVVQIVWSVRIVQARGKGLAATVFLLLPVTSLFAFLYLAFSNSAPPKQERVVEIMTLEAA
jgi:hypothetical protein